MKVSRRPPGRAYQYTVASTAIGRLRPVPDLEVEAQRARERDRVEDVEAVHRAEAAEAVAGRGGLGVVGVREPFRRSTRRSRSSPRCRCRTGWGTTRRRRRSSRRLRPTRPCRAGSRRRARVPTWWPLPFDAARRASRGTAACGRSRARRQPAWNSRLSLPNGAGVDARSRPRCRSRPASPRAIVTTALLRERHREPADQQVVARDGHRERRVGVPGRAGAEEIDQRRVARSSRRRRRSSAGSTAASAARARAVAMPQLGQLAAAGGARRCVVTEGWPGSTVAAAIVDGARRPRSARAAAARRAARPRRARMRRRRPRQLRRRIGAHARAPARRGSGGSRSDSRASRSAAR